MVNESIDSGREFDWGRASEDYARYRDIYPDEFYRKLLSEGLCGNGRRILDIGTGTGVLPRNLSKYGGHFVGADISENQIKYAKILTEKAGLDIDYVVCSAEKLPFEDGSFDTVLSLNGFHAFPDKEAAYRETLRVLRPGGTFCGCFYVEGAYGRTDWMVKHIYQPAKFFTPPYETVDSLRARLKRMYADVRMDNLKSIAWFVCRKAEK